MTDETNKVHLLTDFNDGHNANSPACVHRPKVEVMLACPIRTRTALFKPCLLLLKPCPFHFDSICAYVIDKVGIFFLQSGITMPGAAMTRKVKGLGAIPMVPI